MNLRQLNLLNQVCAFIAFFGCQTWAETYTSREPAGEAYVLQGEFNGSVEAWGGAWGGQVISLANSEFKVILFPGGLPGDGYKKDLEKRSLSAKSDGKTAIGNSDDFQVTISPEKMIVTDQDGKLLGEFTKVERQSVTLGATPPEGSVVLFDGTSAEPFVGGKIVDGRYLGVGCESTETFGDHHLHLEFCVPFMPKDRGQGRGNSGVYLQGRYEIQILDSFGLEGKDNECGGIYQVAKPLVNMCYPPLVWQSYDIDFTAAKYDAQGSKTSNALVTVKHNGVLIHESLELPSHTPGKNVESASAGPLYLQDHKNPVVFQNIWVVKR